MQASKFWPWALDQEHGIAMLNARLANWKKAVTLLIDYFEQRIRLQRTVASADKTFQAKLEHMESFLDAGSEGALRPWIAFAQQSQHISETTEKKTFSLIVKRLQTLKTDVSKKGLLLERELSSLLKSVNKQRSKTLGAIQSSERTSITLERATSTDSGSTPVIDPWLTDRVLKHQLTEMVNTENDFQEKVSNLFDEMASFDSAVVEELKRIMEQFALVEREKLGEVKNLLSVSVDTIVKFPSFKYFGSFVTLYNLNAEAVWKSKRCLTDFPVPVRNIDVLKRGLLYRPSKLGMNMWLPLFCVITKSGFFHCFKNKSKELKGFYEAKENSKADHTNDSEFLSDNDKAESSLSLAQPRIIVQSVITKPSVFEIVIHDRKSKIFSSGIKESFRKYEFKALSEDDMIEWMGCLQYEISSYFPTSAPSPLFKTQKEIKNHVEEVVNNLSLKRASSSGDFEQSFEETIRSEQAVDASKSAQTTPQETKIDAVEAR